MATMINNLSVGDWVHHDFYEVDMRVKTIYGDTERIIAESNDGYEVTCHIDHFSPIPLTPEILEANGWEKVSEVVYKWRNEKHRVFVWLNGFSHYIDVEEMDKEFVAKSSRIEVSQFYVHQLQHALRLAEVDKEIVMPK